MQLNCCEVSRLGNSPQQSQFYFYSGRVALCGLLRALQVTIGDEVIVPVYTCPAVVEPIVGLGARAVYCDVERRTFGLDPERVAALLSNKTKALIVQHTFGVPGRLDDLVGLAQEHGIAVLEDCCHVSSSAYHGRQLGEIGDAAFFSHAWGKPLSVGGGGVAVVHSSSFTQAVAEAYAGFEALSLVDEMRTACSDGALRAKKLARRCLPRVADKLSKRQRVQPGSEPMPLAEGQLGHGYSKRIPRLFNHRIRHLREASGPRLSARRHAVRCYEQEFRRIGIECFDYPKDCDVVLWRYPLVSIDKVKLLEEAARSRAALADWGTIPLRFVSRQGFEKGKSTPFPVAADIARHLVTLLIEETLNLSEIDRNLTFLRSMKKCGIL